MLEKEFWRSNVSSIHKLCFLNGLLYYVATSLVGKTVIFIGSLQHKMSTREDIKAYDRNMKTFRMIALF